MVNFYKKILGFHKNVKFPIIAIKFWLKKLLTIVSIVLHKSNIIIHE